MRADGEVNFTWLLNFYTYSGFFLKSFFPFLFLCAKREFKMNLIIFSAFLMGKIGPRCFRLCFFDEKSDCVCAAEGCFHDVGVIFVVVGLSIFKKALSRL